jgi:hypothetical protein
MIIDRVEFAYRQVSFLQILPSWFTEIRNRQQSSDILVDAGIAPLVATLTLTALRERLGQQATEKVARLEHVGTLHTDLVQFWNSKLSEIRNQTTLKDIQLLDFQWAPHLSSLPLVGLRFRVWSTSAAKCRGRSA